MRWAAWVAIAIERARAVEPAQLTKLRGKESGLKSALLDSVTHDFRTPLTFHESGGDQPPCQQGSWPLRTATIAGKEAGHTPLSWRSTVCGNHA